MLKQDSWCVESFYWLKCKISIWREAIFAFPAGKKCLEKEIFSVVESKLEQIRDSGLYVHSVSKCELF